MKQKISRTVDLSTGRQGARAMFAVIREKEHSHPQCRRRKIQKRVEQFASQASSSFRADKKDDDDDESDDDIISNNNSERTNNSSHQQPHTSSRRKRMRRTSW